MLERPLRANVLLVPPDSRSRVRSGRGETGEVNMSIIISPESNVQRCQRPPTPPYVPLSDTSQNSQAKTGTRILSMQTPHRRGVLKSIHLLL